MRALSVSALLLCLAPFPVLAGSGVCTFQDSLTITPASPAEGETILLAVQGQTGSSLPFVEGQTVEIDGNVIRLTAVVNPGLFAVPGTYVAGDFVGPLPAGVYQVEYYVRCFVEGFPPGNPYLATTGQFEVRGAISPSIPTLSTWGLIGLALLLASFALRFVSRSAPGSRGRLE